MDRFRNPQQQPRYPTHRPLSPRGPLPNNNMNPWDPANAYNTFTDRPQFAGPPSPLTPTHFATTSSPHFASPVVPVQTPNSKLVPIEHFLTVLDKVRVCEDQNKLLQDNYNELQKRIAELETIRNETSVRHALETNEANAEAIMWKEEYFKEKLKCDNIIRERDEMSSKMVESENERTNLNSKLQAEEKKNQELSCTVSTLEKTAQRLKNNLKCHTSAHKEELEGQQKEFKKKLEDCSDAVEREMQLYIELAIKWGDLMKENVDIQKQMDKLKQENSKLLADLKTKNEKMECSPECQFEQENQELWKLVRQLKQSNDSEIILPKRRRKMKHERVDKMN
ncbi:unnamed protein product [Orchesella dallaii]|uniref:Uncharacterized protein n=1 Tax=Orchesella dallaii TaxID=48710 RepID=A0ABP1QJH1_9HEXA